MGRLRTHLVSAADAHAAAKAYYPDEKSKYSIYFVKDFAHAKWRPHSIFLTQP
jgi:hypothetical protein